MLRTSEVTVRLEDTLLAVISGITCIQKVRLVEHLIDFNRLSAREYGIGTCNFYSTL